MNNTVWSACYETHPTLSIGGGTVLGGNCGSPMVRDFDIYIGLDSHSYRKQERIIYPWSKKTDSNLPAHDFMFPIQDMDPPKDVVNFTKMIDWLAAQLKLGKKVHIGCIGGHGRTGTVLAALVAQINKEADAISWVRENYCKKAVESKAQIAFLVTNYNVATAKPAKGEPLKADPSFTKGGKVKGRWDGGSYYGTNLVYGGKGKKNDMYDDLNEYDSAFSGTTQLPAVISTGKDHKFSPKPHDLNVFTIPLDK